MQPRRVTALLAALAPSTAFVSAACGNGPHSLVPPFTNEHSQEVCKQCTTSTGCQWCPLSQSCGSKRSFGRDANCMGSRDQDKPVDSGANCDASAPRPDWMEVLERRYGKSLEEADSDVMRCLQGRVQRWTVWPEPEKTGRSEQEVSDHSCMSAVLREAVLASLGPEPQVLLMTNSTSSSGGDLWARRLASDGWEVEQEIRFCAAFKELVPDEPCEAWSYGMQYFPALRQKAASPGGYGPSDLTEDIRKSMKSGPLRPHKDFDEGFHSTWDRKFSIHLGFDELKNLQSFLKGQPKRSAQPLGSYLQSNKYSLLQRVYGLVFVKILDVKAYALLLANEGHGLDVRAKSFHADVVRYDLKGRSRSQRKKQSSKTKKVLLNGDFAQREKNGTLPFKNWHCKELKKVLRKDVQFLESHGMAEYSLFVEIATARGSARVGCSGLPSAPLCNDNEQAGRTSTVSIIDYFNDKIMDSSSKKFGNQMLEFLDGVCLTGKKEKLDSWQVYVILFCFAALLIGGAAGCWFYGAGFLRSTRPHELRADAAVEMTMRNPGMQAAPPGWPGMVSAGYPAGYPAAYPTYPGYPGRM